MPAHNPWRFRFLGVDGQSAMAHPTPQERDPKQSPSPVSRSTVQSGGIHTIWTWSHGTGSFRMPGPLSASCETDRCQIEFLLRCTRDSSPDGRRETALPVKTKRFDLSDLRVAAGISACRRAGHPARWKGPGERRCLRWLPHRIGRQDAALYGSQDGCRYGHRQLGDALGGEGLRWARSWRTIPSRTAQPTTWFSESRQ